MTEKILKGHKVAKGKAKGIALVSNSPISFYGGVNPEAGLIAEKGHELEGASITGRVLVFPVGKGGASGASIIYELASLQKAPKAIINNRTVPVIAVGVIMGDIPTMDRVEPDPLEAIKTGDLVEVDADQGIIKVWRLA